MIKFMRISWLTIQNAHKHKIEQEIWNIYLMKG